MSKILILAFLCLGLAGAFSQTKFTQDASGNLTNVVAGTNGPVVFSTNGIQTIALSNQLSLSVMVTSAGILSYQWQRNGTNVSGATNATYYSGSVGVGDAGVYSVVVSNSYGIVTNQVGTVTVLASTNTLYGISYGLGQFVAVGENGTVAVSSNLISWSAVTSGTSNRLEAVTFSNGLFVAVGSAGTIINSTNGRDWSVASSGNSNDLKGVCYGSGVFTAVGWGGTTITSSNAITWITRTFDDPKLEAVAFGTNRFVAVGRNGLIWTSTNGAVSWTDHSYVTNLNFNGVTYASGRFIAVGDGGLTMSSTDGISWTPHMSGIAQALQAITYFNNTFFAVGPPSFGYISADGTSWGTSATTTFDTLYGVAAGTNALVAVGKNGTIVQLPALVIDHFDWAQIPSPQRISNSFNVTVTARDGANNAVSNFNGTAAISVKSDDSLISATLLGGPTNTLYGFGTNTVGNVFTPTRDLLVTHVRYCSGKNVSIWTDAGVLLARVSVSSSPGVWAETPLGAPLTLYSGKTYVVSVYNEGYFYAINSGSTSFTDGALDQAISVNSTNAFPGAPNSYQWWLVDLRYQVNRSRTPAATPTVVSFVNGVGSTNVSVSVPSTNAVLQATDDSGHIGSSNPFQIIGATNLSITLSSSANPVSVNSNFVYTIQVMNAGPDQATSVSLTNTLPTAVNSVSVTTSQGSCTVTNGQVTCAIGTLTNQALATVSITATPTSPGIWLTNTAIVSRSEAEAYIGDNTATNVTYVAPALFVSDVLTNEGNVGYKSVIFAAHLSTASPVTVFFDYFSQDGSVYTSAPALAGFDYQAVSGTAAIPPGITDLGLILSVKSDTVAEQTKSFRLNILNVVNATLTNSHAPVCIITNDDGIIGQKDHLVWASIPSPQRLSQAFSATLTMKDISNSTVTTFTGAANFTGINFNRATNTLLTNAAYNFVENNATFTLGYQFTPKTNIVVTHVRMFSGTKVSLWTDRGYLLTSLATTNAGGVWSDVPLPTPILLVASNIYRLGFLTGGFPYYSRIDHPTNFSGGSIDQSFYAVGDAFPSIVNGAEWYLVDLRYAFPASMTPSVSGNFTAGVWTGNITVSEASTNFVVLADDGDGHLGYSPGLGVYASNDLALTVSTTPTAPIVNSNFTYSLLVLNSGPNASTGVKLTNTLPDNVTFLSVTQSQGTCSVTSNSVSCDLGTIGDLGTASVTIVVVPLIAGASLTNTASVVRTESGDPDLSNNIVTIVQTPNVAETVLIADATDTPALSWRSGGAALWFYQTNVTHDGTDAAQSGAIGDNQESWIETTIRGPCTFSFWWKVSSETNGDSLIFTANGVVQTNISGSPDWQQRAYLIPSNLFALRWTYRKNSLISSGSDAAWLDQVVQTVPAFSFSGPIVLTNGQFQVTLNGTNGQRLVIQGSQDLATWASLSTNFVTTNGTTVYTDSQATNFVYRFYRATHRNE